MTEEDEPLRGRALIEDIHPIGDPSRWHTIHVGQELQALMRYLAHATLADKRGDALPAPGDVDSLIWSLVSTAQGMSQVLSQVQQRLVEFRRMSRFACDDGDRDQAVRHAHAAEMHLQQLARDFDGVADRLNAVGRETSHLNFEFE